MIEFHQCATDTCRTFIAGSALCMSCSNARRAALKEAADAVRSVEATHAADGESWSYASGFRTGIEVAVSEIERLEGGQ